jgi:demethylmenaquinone methyltransferase/2-methoxy-6-polyprenyl-1,4-benzoquinol methylase
MATPRDTPVLEKSRTPEMFSEIAHRYDFLNHLLSLNVDRRWRRTLVDMAGIGRGGRVLDAATGTGDVAITFARRTRAATIVGLDPSDGMLSVGREKLRRLGLDGRVRLLDGDALAIPFADKSFDAVTIAFGLRNLPDYAAGIAEMTRVLAPGGRLLILEFFPPRRGFFLEAYRFYLGHVLPLVGRVVSGSPGAYRYLSRSIEEFISHDQIRAYLEGAGLSGVAGRKLTGGVAYIYSGTRR